MTETKIQPAGELGRITFAGAEIRPPAPLLIGRGDRLFIRSKCAIADAIVSIRGRLLYAPNTLAPFEYRHTPNSDRSAAFEVFELTPGFLMGLHVAELNGGAVRGNCFVEVGLLRGRGVAGDIVQTLLADYATIDGALGWPGARILSSVDGRGALRSIAGTNPAAAAEVAEVVPANARWRLHGVLLVLVTDANVANRRVHLLIDDGTTVIYRAVSASVQTASTTEQYNVGAHGITSASVAGEHFIPIPWDYAIPAGFRIRTSTDNIQVGDDYAAPQLFVEEWIEE